jgi:hypothetical protein
MWTGCEDLAGKRAGRTVKQPSFERRGGSTFAVHRAGTTWPVVDSVWTAMYESNQRSNRLNNKP